MDDEALLVAVSRHGLPAARVAAPVPPSLTSGDARRILAQARQHNLVGLLDQAVADGVVTCDAEGARQIGAGAVRTAGWSLCVERHLLDVDGALAAAGIEHRFLKGATWAHRFYLHPGLRPFVDVDVLVRGDDVDRTVRLLVAAGHRRLQPEPRPGFSARFGKSVTLRSADGIEVDLHRSLAPGPLGLAADPTHWWSSPPALVRLGTRDVPAFGVGASFVHACTHASTARTRHLGALRDVRQLAALVDPAEVADIAARLRLRGCVVAALRESRVIEEDPTAIDQAAARWRVPRREVRWAQSYRKPGGSYTRSALDGLLALPGLRPRLAYAQALALPDAPIRDRRGGTGARIRRAMRQVRR